MGSCLSVQEPVCPPEDSKHIYESTGYEPIRDGGPPAPTAWVPRGRWVSALAAAEGSIAPAGAPQPQRTPKPPEAPSTPFGSEALDPALKGTALSGTPAAGLGGRPRGCCLEAFANSAAAAEVAAPLEEQVTELCLAVFEVRRPRKWMHGPQAKCPGPHPYVLQPPVIGGNAHALTCGYGRQ
jgi:hypothetical protein